MLMLFVAVFSGCKKEEPGVKELLTKKWKVTSGTYNGDFDESYVNSTIHFKSGDRFSIFYFQDNIEVNGDWFLEDNESEIRLVFDIGGDDEIWEITRIDKNVLKLRYTYYFGGDAFITEITCE